jgi:glycosyltransferase involved in cell wall biosynthesis
VTGPPAAPAAAPGPPPPACPPGLGVESLHYGCDISFFVPALNEQELIVPTLETLLGALGRFRHTFEILVVDDGSTDETAARVEAFMAAHPEAPIRLIRNPKNRGLGRNYVDAAFAASGRYYKLVCGDNPEPQHTIEALLAHLGEADMITPYLRNDPRHWKRKYLSIAFTKLVNLVGGYRLRYYNGTAIHLRYNVMRWHSDTYGFAFNAEIITRLLNEGASIVEVPIDVVEAAGRTSRAFSFHNILSVPHSLLQIFLRRLRRVLFKI